MISKFFIDRPVLAYVLAIVIVLVAFILGVVTLVTATGAGANARISLGLSVFSGMIASACLAVLFVPSFLVVLQRFEESREAGKRPAAGLKRMAVPPALPPATDLIPALHLARYSAAASPKVAIIGDSTATEIAHVLYPTESIWGLLMQELQRQNPKKAHTFSNYAIGGANFAHMTMTGTASGLPLPPWFTTPGNTWLSYIDAFAPDLLFICAGINQAEAPQLNYVGSLLAAVATWNKVPDLVFISNKAANPDAGGVYLSDQPIYPGMASAIRSLCRANGAPLGVAGAPPLGLIDLGRYQMQSVFGYDPDVQALVPKSGLPISGITTFPYVCPASSNGDFDLQFRFPSQGASLWSGGCTAISVSLSPYTASGFTNVLQFPYGGGNIAAIYFIDGYNSSGEASVASGSGDITIRLLARSERLIAIVNGVTVFDKRVARYQMAYQPTVTLLGSPTAPSMTIDAMNDGQARQTTVALSHAMMWGATAADGNQINHPCSFGVMNIDAPVIQSTRFA